MLYELNVIHEWDATVPSEPALLPFLRKPSTCSIQYSPVSHDGEYVAVVTPASIEIRSKRQEFEVVCQLPGSVFAWSTNSAHLAVLESEGSEVVVYTVEGVEVFRKVMTGSVIDKMIIWRRGTVFNLCLLTEMRHQLVLVLGKKVSFHYSETPLGEVYLQEEQLITLQPTKKGLQLVCRDVESLEETNTFTCPTGCLLALGNCEGHLLALADNATRTLSLYFLCTMKLAKRVPYVQISNFSPVEAVRSVTWWVKDTLAVLTSTGRLFFLSYKTLEVEEAETFLPSSFLLPSPPKSVIVLEEQRTEPEHSLLSLVSRSRDTSSTIHERLVQVLQTSPEVLFRQKIAGGEFGEAILLANKFELDADEVYKAQWRCNNSHPSAIQDFLTKVLDDEWVLDEIESFVAPDITFATQIIEYGNHRSDKSEWLGNARVVVALYAEVLEREPTMVYDGALLHLFYTLPLVEMGMALARQGYWTAIDVLLTKDKTRPIVEEYWLVLLSLLPETLSPSSYQDILPEFVTKPSVRYAVDLSCSFLSWATEDGSEATLGMWDEESFELPTTTLTSRAPSEVPPHLQEFVGPITPESVIRWYTSRASLMVELSCLYEHAISLLSLGIERLVPLDILQCGLSLLQSAACYGSTPTSPSPLRALEERLPVLILGLLDRVPGVERVPLLHEVVLPFLAGLLCVTGQQVPLDRLLAEMTPILCRDTLLPALQILQSKELTVPDPHTLATTALISCRQSADWLPTARKIVAFVSSLQPDLRFAELALQHLGGMAPAELFSALRSKEQYPDLLRRVAEQAFPLRDTVLVGAVGELGAVGSEVRRVLFECAVGSGHVEVVRCVVEAVRGAQQDEEWTEMVQTHAELLFYSCPDVKNPAMEIVRLLLSDSPSSELADRLQVLDTLQTLGLTIKPAMLRSESPLGILRLVLKVNSANYTKVSEISRMGEMLSLPRSAVLVSLLEEALHHTNYQLCRSISQDIVSHGYTDGVGVVARVLRILPTTGASPSLRSSLVDFVLEHGPVQLVDEMMELAGKRPESSKLDKLFYGAPVYDLRVDPEEVERTESLDRLYQIYSHGVLYESNVSIDTVSSLPHVLHAADPKQLSPDLRAVHTKISNILQGDKLRGIKGDINVPRFTYDTLYRRSVIMSIAASDQLDLALVLATKYSLDPWEVHFAHYSWRLRSDQDVPQATLDLLQTRETEFLERCRTEIYPELVGSQAGPLILYFRHTGEVGRARALEKLRSALTGLDWKVFLEAEPSELLGMLEPHLSDGTVHVIGKVAPTLHPSLSKSDIFARYASRTFLTGSQSADRRWQAVRSVLQHISEPAPLLTRMALHEGLEWELRLQISEGVPEVRRYLERWSLPLDHPYLPVYLRCYSRPDLTHMMLISMVLDPAVPAPDVTVLCPGVSGEELVERAIGWLTGSREIPGEITCTALQTEENLFEQLVESGIQPREVLLSKLKLICEEGSPEEGVLSEMIGAVEPHLTSTDTPLLVYFRTRPLLQLHFPGIEISPGVVPSGELFEGLCGAAEGRFVACCALFDVLKVWADLRREEEWAMMLLTQLSRLEVSDSCCELVSEVVSFHSDLLSRPSISRCQTELFPALPASIAVLSSEHPDLVELANVPSHPLTTRLILERELYLTDPSIVPSLGLTDYTTVERVARRLRESGALVDSLSLLANFSRSAYQTFASYLSYS